MKKNAREQNAARVRIRLRVAGGLLLVLFLTVAVRAFQLQVLEGPRLARLGEKQHLQEWIFLPKRGSILGRDGKPLALSLEAQSIYVRPRRLETTSRAVPLLADALNMKPQEVRRRIKNKSSFVWLRRQVTPRQARRVRALRLKGIGMYHEAKRYYPRGHLAGHVIGLAGRDSQGLEGIERHYDAYIRGAGGSSVVERDALGRRVLTTGLDALKVPAGADVELTLDTSLQHLSEKYLEATVKKYGAKAGTALMVDPFTGEVLAMANYPFFDPNHYARQAKSQWRNRAVTDTYEPGSTFKAILAAAAIEEGVVGEEDLFFVSLVDTDTAAVSYAILRSTAGSRSLRFSNIPATSGLRKLPIGSKRNAITSISGALDSVRKPALTCLAEVRGILRPAKRWADIDLAAHSFGQSLGVTPMQMVMAYSAIANGGYLMRPYLVHRVAGKEGEVLFQNEPQVVRRVISEETARTLTEILKGVVRPGGTGARAALDGFEIAGKTGTSQKADLVRGGYSATKRIASFIGFAPADAPRVVLLTLIDEPKVNVYGGVVAAPLFRKIVGNTLRSMSAVPQTPPDPFLQTQNPAGLIRVAHVRAAEPGPSAAKGSAHFIGLSMRDAISKAKKLHVSVELRGHGYVVRQQTRTTAGKRRVVLTLRD